MILLCRVKLRLFTRQDRRVRRTMLLSQKTTAMTQPPLTFRLATRDDLPAIVRMLVDDALGNAWDRYDEPLLPVYYEAFQAIAADRNNELVVAQSGDEVVGVLQLTYLPGLLFQGGWRALIEGV